MIDSKIPPGPLDQKWTYYKGHCKLVNPANKRKLEVIVIGTGLAGASAAASLGELGYQVKAFCFQDSPRRAHSIAAQGGINAAKITRTTATLFFAFFTILLKVATTVHAKPTYTAWQK
jgi:Succinate dehydrogenase/fumarate reductase, flavoprotein subunit